MVDWRVEVIVLNRNFSTNDRSFQIVLATFVALGWMSFIFQSRNQDLTVSASVAPQPALQAQKKKLPAKKTATERRQKAPARVVEMPTTVESLEQAIQVSNEAAELEFVKIEHNDQSQRVTVDGNFILLTDKGRPRISKKNSDFLLPTLAYFSSTPKKVVAIIEATSDTPESYIRAQERFLQKYKGWRVQTQKVEGEGRKIQIKLETVE